MGRWVPPVRGSTSAAAWGFPAALAALAALVALAVAGCGGGSATAGDPRPTLTISSAPADGEQDAPVKLPAEPQRPRDVESRAGAEAFASFAVETIWYAASTHDTQALLALDANGTCSSCRELDRKLDRDSWQVPVAGDREPAEVRRADLTAVDGRVRLLGVVFDNPPLKEIAAGGRVVERLPGRKRQYVDVGLTWQQGQWVLNDYKYPES
jgi:Family of unknown function (DUF6318)